MARKLMYWSVTLLFILTLGVACERRAYAYTDPGSCLLLFQSLGAAVSGALFFFRRRLKQLFRRSEAKPALKTSVAMSRADS